MPPLLKGTKGSIFIHVMSVEIQVCYFCSRMGGRRTYRTLLRSVLESWEGVLGHCVVDLPVAPGLNLGELGQVQDGPAQSLSCGFAARSEDVPQLHPQVVVCQCITLVDFFFFFTRRSKCKTFHVDK